MNTAAQRCKFLSHQRGMKELNYLLERFTERRGGKIWEDPLYQELMEYDDIWLWDALMTPESASTPQHLAPLIDVIRSNHVSAHD